MKNSHIHESTEKQQGMIYFPIVHYSSRMQPLVNHTFGGRMRILMGLLNPTLCIVTPAI
jgi:hypothetical protein